MRLQPEQSRRKQWDSPYSQYHRQHTLYFARPEDRRAKKARLLGEAEARGKGVEVDKKRPMVVKYGINHITEVV